MEMYGQAELILYVKAELILYVNISTPRFWFGVWLCTFLIQEFYFFIAAGSIHNNSNQAFASNQILGVKMFRAERLNIFTLKKLVKLEGKCF